MSSSEIRNIGSLAWSDSLAWMESMSGSEWESTIDDENELFQKSIRSAGGVSKKLVSVFQKSALEHIPLDVFVCNKIFITPNGTGNYLWRWFDSDVTHSAAAVYSKGDFVWAAESDTEGKEIYTLVCYKKGEKTPAWSHDVSIGPFLAVEGDQCYYLETSTELRYSVLVSVHAETGGVRRVLYKESDPRYNCRVISGENGCIFLLSENSGRHKLFHVKDLLVKRLHPSSDCFFPVGYGSEHGVPCYFVKSTTIWTAIGKGLESFNIPNSLFQNSSIVLCSIASQFLITSSNGISKFYELRRSVRPKLLYSIIGNCTPNEADLFKGSNSIRFFVTVPGAYPVFFHRTGFGNLGMSPIQLYADIGDYRTARGVPYILVVPLSKKPTNLMVIVYGGYGLATKLNTARWKPYIECGWALVFALVRGGGDRDEDWAEAGRRHMKYNSIYDTENVIRTAQQQLGLSWKETCIYGRSAGGYNVGSIVARHGNGGVIAAAYAEVPYVDILRTTTNPSLPLTVLEYDEFGHPSERIEDFSTILRFSPVDSLSPEGAPEVFVVVRTSVNDREVLTYESVKWITRLRGFPIQTKKSLPKLLAVTGGAGHFVRGATADRQMAEDFVLLNYFFQTRCAKKSQ